MNGFDYKGFEKWAKSIGVARKEFNKWLEDFLISEAMEVEARGKPRTPVDTGLLKSCWYIGNVVRKGNNLEIEIGIGNPADYASFVEYGHHSYEGRYMLTLSMDEVERAMPNQFYGSWLAFLKEKGVA